MRRLLGSNSVHALMRLLSGGVGLMFLVLGLGLLITPEVIATPLFSLTSSAAGVSSLRGDFGALFLGMSFFCLLGVFSPHRWLLLIPSVFLGLVVAGRLISLLVDDLPVTVTLVAELAFLLLLTLTLISYSLTSNGQDAPPALKAVFTPRFMVILGMVVVMVAGGLAARRQIGAGLWKRGSVAGLSRTTLADLPDGLHVGLAGTGAPLPDAKRAGVSTFVKAGKHLFIVDSGPGSTVNLELMQVPLHETEAVLLTHFHSDHIAGLGELMLKAWISGARTQRLRILGPEGVETVVEGFNQAYALDSGYRTAHHGRAVAPQEGAGGSPETIDGFDENESAVVFQNDDLLVTAFLVDHRPVEVALGFRFDYRGRSVVISGDTLPTESLRRHAEGADLLLHEALQPDMLRGLSHAADITGRDVVANVSMDILTYHTFPEEAARIAQDANVGHLVLHHILPPMPAAILHPVFLGDSRKYYRGPITIGADGMLFSLPTGSTKVEKRWLL